MNRSAMLHVGVAVGVLTAMTGCEHEVVTPVIVTRVTVEPDQAVLPQGDTLHFTASVYDELDQLLYQAAVEWSSERPQVVSVAADGAARTHDRGSTRVRASIGGVSGSATVTVVPPIDCSKRGDRDRHDDEDDDDDETDSQCAPPPG